MEIIRGADIASFANAGVVSEQLLFPENSTSQRGCRSSPHEPVALGSRATASAGRQHNCTLRRG